MKINTKLMLAFLLTTLILLVATSVVSYLHAKEILAPLADLWNILLPIMFFLLAVLLLTCLFFFRTIKHSIHSLTQTTTEICQGDLSRRLEITSNDEIGTLAQAFNQMTDSLTQQIEERNTAVELYNSLANSPAVGVYIVQDKKFVFANAKFQAITGYTEEELLSTDSMKIVYPEDRQMVRDNAVAMLKGKSLKPYEFKIVRKNGQLIWAMETVTSVQYNNRPATLSNFMDITERMQAEKALQDSQEKVLRIFESINDGIQIMDLNGSVVDVNEKMVKIRGAGSKDNLLGRTVFELDPHVDRETILSRMKTELEKGPVQNMEIALRRVDGSECSVELNSSVLRDASGNPFGFIGVHRDITERKQAEERLRNLMESVPVGLCITTQDGRTLEANTAQLEIFGYDSKEDYLKLPVIGAYNNPDDRKRFLKLANKGFVKDFEVQFKRKNGEVFWASLTAVAQKVRRNQPQYIVSVQDITDRRQAREELENLFKEVQEINQQLEQSNHELEDFAYVASHDLREPLRKIISFSEILQASLEGRLDEDEHENLGFVIDGARRMQSMIDDLLTYSRITTKAKPFQTVDLNNVIENLKNFELSTALKETEGTIHIPEPLLAVHGDPSQLHQLLQNLISNGLKFHQDSTPPLITISSHPTQKNLIHFNVQDNGIGINEEHYKQIFVMFKRLHSRQSYQGTGIGLATCKKIVERHGGQIGVKSTPGEGSTFWFTLPSSIPSNDKRSSSKPEPETVTTH